MLKVKKLGHVMRINKDVPRYVIVVISLISFSIHHSLSKAAVW